MTVANQRLTILEGTPFHAKFGGLSTPGTPQTLITSVVPANTLRKIAQIIVVCRMYGKWEGKINGTVFASGRTGPGESNSVFPFYVPKEASATQTITIEFSGGANAPSVDLEAYLMAADSIV